MLILWNELKEGKQEPNCAPKIEQNKGEIGD